MNWFGRLRKAVFPADRDKEADTAPQPTAAEEPAPAKARRGRAQRVDDRTPVERLFPREREVFLRLLEGAKMREIAEELNIKTSTVNGYCREVYRKLDVNSKAQLILRYSAYR